LLVLYKEEVELFSIVQRRSRIV